MTQPPIVFAVARAICEAHGSNPDPLPIRRVTERIVRQMVDDALDESLPNHQRLTSRRAAVHHLASYVARMPAANIITAQRMASEILRLDPQPARGNQCPSNSS